MNTIKTLVLPVAGLGLRLRPLTLRTPKNLLTIAGKPMIEYVIEEARESGIENVVLVVSPDHRQKFEAYMKRARKMFPQFSFFLRVQRKPLGHGHAVLQAADVIGNRPCAVRFCDDLVIANPPVLISLLKLYAALLSPIVLLERVPMRSVSRYGVVQVRPAKNPVKAEVAGSLYRVTRFVEKPNQKEAPSNLAVIGGYILTPRVIRELKRSEGKLTVVKNDVLLIYAGLQAEMRSKKGLYGWEFIGKRLDCGTLESFKDAERYVKKMAI